MCIKGHTGREIVKNDFLTILICWIYANYRNPTGYPQRSRDVKSSVASYPSSGQIFGTFPVETLRIAFRKENPIDLFEVSQGAERGVRLLDRESIDTFMLALQSEVVSQ